MQTQNRTDQKNISLKEEREIKHSKAKNKA
jgi:hypothetical protein